MSKQNNGAAGADAPNHKSPASQPGTTGDPFADLNALRLSQNFAAELGVRKALLTVPVRKPDRTWFSRVHPDESYRLQTAVLEMKDERETYLVEPALLPELLTGLPGMVVPVCLFTAINRQGVEFLWPCRLPGEDGRVIEWHRSALEAANLATRNWVRVAANMTLGAYEVFKAPPGLPDPIWPEPGFQDLLRIAFKQRFISSLDHPALMRLRGEI